ncbi:ATPase, T2SS/T4P/T4SS family [Methanoregula sp.]|uniref:ATPase, T2SS/T4P/T4SS family n=1 Tax=Methanoregula sp. TaxID=2052170 RepID=UPI0035698F46
MKKDNDDSFDEVNSLMKKIGRAKKGEPDPLPASGSPVPDLPDQAGDFSALLKKLGKAGKPEHASQPAPAEIPVPAPPLPEDEPRGQVVMSLDDLLDDIPDTDTILASGSSIEIPVSDPDAAVTTIPAETQDRVPPAAATRISAQPVSSAAGPVTGDNNQEILQKIKTGKKVAAEEPVPATGGSDEEEKIISVDQISDISGLILPRGARFRIDELQLHGRISSYEGSGLSTLPPEFHEIWKKNFSSVSFKDLDVEKDFFTDTETPLPVQKGFSIGALFKAIRSEQEEYDPAKHGPLVDLAFQDRPGIEDLETYPVNEPYAYIRITYDHSTHEYTYHVLEPALTDPEKDLLKELKERLFETLDINTKDITKDEAKNRLRTATVDIIHDYGIKLSPLQREKIHYNMFKDFLGDGLIDAIMHDKYIEDISCDGVHTPIFAFHSSYESMKTTLAYNTAEDLDSFVTKLAQRAGKYISIAEPILDATMQDGSRIQMTLGTEVTAHGSTFTIRKFKDEPITPTDLIEWHTFAPLSIAYIWLAVENGKSAIFAGGTASGKTTALNAISLFIPPMAKIVSLEDTRELKLPHPNWIPSVTRDSFDTAGRGEINMYELLRAAMRQRPEYIIVGEVRGKECQTLFQAMSTGHVTYSTTHADSVASVVHRIENPPMDVPRNMLSALDFICVQVQARVGGKRIRRNKQIVEILDIDPRTNELITNEVFKWRSATDEHTYSGKSYLLEEIMEAKGWDESRMREELKRRQEVLEWMRIKKIRHYKDVAKILISYHRDPEAVIENVRKDLYE